MRVVSVCIAASLHQVQNTDQSVQLAQAALPIGRCMYISQRCNRSAFRLVGTWRCWLVYMHRSLASAACVGCTFWLVLFHTRCNMFLQVCGGDFLHPYSADVAATRVQVCELVQYGLRKIEGDRKRKTSQQWLRRTFTQQSDRQSVEPKGLMAYKSWCSKLSARSIHQRMKYSCICDGASQPGAKFSMLLSFDMMAAMALSCGACTRSQPADYAGKQAEPSKQVWRHRRRYIANGHAASSHQSCTHHHKCLPKKL